MNGTESSRWDNLIIESSAHPAFLTEERFRAWMEARRIFVSSVMDSEMRPIRDAVRNTIHELGGSPILWEEMTPRDEKPQQAYFGGVDRSNLFVLLLGTRYGVTDSSGYSPTHQEANRARERKIPRLLFTLGTVKDSDRDGRLNDWLRSLHVEIAGASFDSNEELLAQLAGRLREIAAKSERFWIKLGRLVFPGIVSSTFQTGGESTFLVTARVNDGEVRHALLRLGQPFTSSSRTERLTWSNNSFPVQVKSVGVKSEFSTQDVVEIACHSSANFGTGSTSVQTMLASFGNKSAGDVATLWARRALLGDVYQSNDRNRFDLATSFSEPDVSNLPEILKQYHAAGWVAEGLARLYAVEEVSRRYDGQFRHLEVGPSTGTHIKLAGSFRFKVGYGTSSEVVSFDGEVPLS